MNKQELIAMPPNAAIYVVLNGSKGYFIKKCKRYELDIKPNYISVVHNNNVFDVYAYNTDFKAIKSTCDFYNK